MSAPTSSNQSKSRPLNPLSSPDSDTCPHCGGNGYMKTNPNCYHTCLECLGRGLLVIEQNHSEHL